MRGKSRVAVDCALMHARLNPGKRVLIYSADEATAKEARSRLAEQNGGARPFNVAVRALGSTDSGSGVKNG